ncbi:LuxR C-terminal-related transcriptional regulator, partial [Streptomyces sp. NPDC057927]
VELSDHTWVADRRAWSVDRLHPSELGHRLLAREFHSALRAGASGFLVKDGPADSLVGAIRTVAGGEAVLSPRVTHRLLDRFAHLAAPATSAVPTKLDALTGRELDVLRALTRGLSNAEIALELGVGETTVKTHVAHILEKFQLRDRVQAVILAYDCGLVVPRGTS